MTNLATAPVPPDVTRSRRPSAVSAAMAVTSIGLSVAISIVLDLVLLLAPESAPFEVIVATILFNSTVMLLSGVGAVIEWRRPGHAIGRLLMLSGPLYAFLGLSWLASEVLKPLMDPRAFQLVFWSSSFLSWPGVALIVAWIPLLFPTGHLPGPRWRIPTGALVGLFGVSLVVLATRSRPTADGSEPVSSPELVNLVAVVLLLMVVLGAAAVIVRYHRGDRIERLQVRWFATAVALCMLGFAATAIQSAVQPSDGPLLMALVLYVGILAIPITIGIAVTRYRLYEIDRIISRTIGWALVTGILVAVFAGLVVGLQAVLPVASGDTLVVAVSTLVAFALFQPLRRRVQHAVDHRFDRARYDGERTAAAFAERLRDQVDLEGLERGVTATVGLALRPRSTGVWIRNVRFHAPARRS